MAIKDGKRFWIIVMAMITMLVLPLAANADDIPNNLDASTDAAAELMPLTVGGPVGTTQLYVTPANGDGKNGCNLTGGTLLTVSVSSSSPSVATVSPSSVTFNSCGDTYNLTITPVASGTTSLSLSLIANTTEGTFNLAPATFTVNVAPPPNRAPTVSVAGVIGGVNYDKGSVPAATCQVTDAEDGSSSFAATLSVITGTFDADGIGSQTASCSYTDGGGLTASASETYTIVDPSAPDIEYTLNPSLPDGNNGWYTSTVSLTWTVTEAESPNSLVKTGCVDQNITTDQAETTFSCSATSAGTSTGDPAGPVSVSIKRDATAPVISGINFNNTTWRNTPLSEVFTASDTTSGLAVAGDASFTLTASDESANANTPTTVSRTVYDNAGNSSTRTFSALIDKTNPVITASLSPAVAGTGWYNIATGAPTVSSTCNDALSGISGACPSAYTFGEGANQTYSQTVSDLAGNDASAGVSSVNVDLTPPTLGCTVAPSFLLNQAGALVTATVTDAGSGPASPTVSGNAITTSVGNKSLEVTGYDNAGNSASKTCSYSVGYHFIGFSSPVDNAGVLNKAKAGQAIPFKWRLLDANGNPVLNLTSVNATVESLSCNQGTTQDQIEEYAPGASSLQNLGDGYYQWNWKSPTTYANSCKTFKLNLGEETLRTALFQFVR